MKFLSALLAATIAASPLAATVADAAPQHREDRRTQTSVHTRPGGRTVVTQHTVVRQQDRAWRRGDRFDSRRARNYRIVNDYRAYRLAAPPRGYRWVRSNNDAVLVSISNGQVREVRGGVIRR